MSQPSMAWGLPSVMFWYWLTNLQPATHAQHTKVSTPHDNAKVVLAINQSKANARDKAMATLLEVSKASRVETVGRRIKHHAFKQCLNL